MKRLLLRWREEEKWGDKKRKIKEIDLYIVRWQDKDQGHAMVLWCQER